MNKEETQTEIKRLVAKAKEQITQAEALADKHGIIFDFSVAYGMGGSYYPQKLITKEHALELIRTNQITDENRETVAQVLEDGSSAWYGSEEGWQSSSQQC